MEATILESLQVRAPTIEDLERVTALINTCAMHDEGLNDTTVEDLQHDWEIPGFNLATDALLICTAEDLPVGIAQLFTEVPFVQNYMRVRVHPDYRGRGIGTRLMRFAEERARQFIDRAPADARVTLLTGVNRRNEAAQELFRNEGFACVRYFSEMEIELKEAPPAPSWPAGITVRTFVPGQDEQAVYEADNEAFIDHWGYVPTSFEVWMHDMQTGKGIEPSLWFLAVDGDQIAGMALCPPEYPPDPTMGWVSSLGVRRAWRKRGIGLALLHHAFGEFYRRGLTKVGLGVDADSLTGATRLYERAGMHAVRQYARYLKELRPGKDLSAQTLAE